MKKVIAINAGPRKGWNTDLLVRDYSLYDWTLFDGAAKKEHHDQAFPAYLRKAFDLGQELLK